MWLEVKEKADHYWKILQFCYILGGTGWFLGGGTKILYAEWFGQKKKKNYYFFLKGEVSRKKARELYEMQITIY